VLLEDNSGVLNVAWFSDEVHIHLDGYVNKQNIQFWASENPWLTVANPLHPERVTVWCALLIVGIFGPLIIDGAVSSDVYLSLLSDEFFPFLMGHGILMNSAWFQQDGARPNTSSAILCFLCDVFRESAINWYPVFSWLSTSPDLNPRGGT
jgi:hypothetical protein